MQTFQETQILLVIFLFNNNKEKNNNINIYIAHFLQK